MPILSQTSGIHCVWPIAPAHEPRISSGVLQPRSTTRSALSRFSCPNRRGGAAHPGERGKRENAGACDSLHKRITVSRLRAQSASSVPRSTPKSRSMRSNRPEYCLSVSLRAIERKSETRRLTYCQTCSLNSGWLRSARTPACPARSCPSPACRSHPKCRAPAHVHENCPAIGRSPPARPLRPGAATQG